MKNESPRYSDTPHETFAYDAADRISSPGYSFDANGSMTEDGEHIYRYDAARRLTAVLDESSEETIAAYEYDFLNRRISATEPSGTVYFHYDAERVIAETDGAGNTIASYSYGPGGVHSMRRDGATYFYVKNPHGDVVALTNSSGQVVNSYGYDPWGRLLESTETVANPYRYAGYRYDEATGLYYLSARYYSPESYRFLTKDPYPGNPRAPDTLNPYRYCADNPISMVDPTGLLEFFGFEVHAFEDHGLAATDYWATKSIDPNNAWYETAAYTGMGLLSALWTPCNSNATFTVLTTAWGVGRWFGRPFWQYYPQGNPGYQSNWLTRGLGWRPPYEPGQQAVRGLNLPPWNPGTAVRPVRVSWWRFVSGPHPVSGGTGVEYFVGLFPR